MVKAVQARRDSLRAVPALPTLFAPKPFLSLPLPQQKQAFVLSGRTSSGPSWGTELKQSLQQVDSVEVSDFLRSSLEKELSQDSASGISDPVEATFSGRPGPLLPSHNLLALNLEGSSLGPPAQVSIKPSGLLPSEKTGTTSVRISMPVTKKVSSKLIKLSGDVPVAPQQKDKDVGNQSTFLAHNQNCEPLVTDSLLSENDKNSSTQSNFTDSDESGPLFSVITPVSDDSLSYMAEKDNGRKEAVVVSEFVQDQQNILCEMELKQFKQEVVTVEPSISFDSANSLSSTTNLPSIDRESRISESMEVSDSVRSSLEKEPSQDAVSVISDPIEAYDGGGSFVQTCQLQASTSSNTVFVGVSRTSESSVDRCGTSEPGGEHERSSGEEHACDEELVTEFSEKKAFVLSSTVNSHFASPEEGKSNISAIMGTSVSTKPTSTFSDSKCAELVPSEQGPIDYLNGGTYTDGLPLKNAEHDSFKKVSRAVPPMVLAAQLTASAPGCEYASFLQFGTITPGIVKAMQARRDSLRAVPALPTLFAPKSLLLHPLPQQKQALPIAQTPVLSKALIELNGSKKNKKNCEDQSKAEGENCEVAANAFLPSNSFGPCGTKLKQSLQQVDSVEVSDFLRSSLEKEPSQDAASGISDPVEASDGGVSFVQTCQLQASFLQFGTITLGIVKAMQARRDSLRAVPALPTLFAPKPLLLHPLPQQKQALVLSGRIIDTSSGPWGTELKQSLEQIDSVEVSNFLRSSLEKEPSQDSASGISDPVEASNAGGSFVQTCQLQASTSSTTVFVGVSRTSESSVDRCDASEPGGEHERSSGGERSSDEELVTEFSEKKSFVLSSTDNSHFASPEEGESISAIMGTAVSTNPTSTFSDSKCAELVPSDQGPIDYFSGSELFDPVLNECEILCSEGTAARQPCILPLEMTTTPSISSEIKPELNYADLCIGAQTPVLSRVLLELNGSKKNKKKKIKKKKMKNKKNEVYSNAVG